MSTVQHDKLFLQITDNCTDEHDTIGIFTVIHITVTKVGVKLFLCVEQRLAPGRPQPLLKYEYPRNVLELVVVNW
ncbi:hypothetical protein J6590_078566 [Homalodisca vitripennis]|nr:hypothetical protein J6590_078566 [Homalodisca vitripennis]